MDRDEFARQFIEKGKSSGASKNDVTMKLQVALNQYDSQFGQESGLGETPPSFLESMGQAIVKPAKDYGNMVLGAGYEAYRAGKSALGDTNAYYDSNKREDVKNPFLDQGEIDQFSDPKSATIEGTKRAIGAMSYVPGGTLPKAVLAGGMYAFSQVDDDAAVDDYVKETVIGGAGGALGYGASKLGGALWSKLTDKVSKIVSSKPVISEEIADKAAKHIIEKAAGTGSDGIPGVAESVYGSGFSFSKKGNAFEKLQPQQTFKTMLNDGVWGTPAQIVKTTNMVTGKDGVVSNIVKKSLDDLGTIDVPSNLISVNDITGKYTLLSGDDVNGLLVRLSKSAPGSTITGKEAGGLFRFQRDLEKEAYEVLSRNSSNGKALEFAKLQLDLASKLEGVLDDAINQSGAISQLAKDPAIIAFLDKNVSRNFAKRFAEAGGDLRLLRALQKDYYRMGKIAELASQENSALGKSMFKWIDQIPGIGATLSSLSSQAEAAIGTGLPVGARAISSKVGAPIQAGASRLGGIAGSMANQGAPIVGAASLGAVPPSL